MNASWCERCRRWLTSREVEYHVVCRPPPARPREPSRAYGSGARHHDGGPLPGRWLGDSDDRDDAQREYDADARADWLAGGD